MLMKEKLYNAYTCSGNQVNLAVDSWKNVNFMLMCTRIDAKFIQPFTTAHFF